MSAPALAIQFVENAAHNRIAHYREQAASLRRMTEREMNSRLRESLLMFAAQYDDLASTVPIRAPLHRETFRGAS